MLVLVLHNPRLLLLIKTCDASVFVVTLSKQICSSLSLIITSLASSYSNDIQLYAFIVDLDPSSALHLIFRANGALLFKPF